MQRGRALVLGILLSGVGALYFAGLGAPTAYLSIEELTAAHQSYSLATTGRSLSGQWLPLYVGEPGYEAGRDPLWVYINAGLMKVWPFSEGLIRAPSAVAGMVDVGLMFLVVYRLFGSIPVATIAAALLALAPAHFIQSRIGTSQIAPVSFMLAWLWCLLGFLKSHRLRDLYMATAALGFGVYSYLAAAFMMPLYLAATIVVLRRHAASIAEADRWRWLRAAMRSAMLGFLLPLLPWVAWHIVHPERFANLLSYYTDNGYNPDVAARVDVPRVLVTRLALWWEAFNPERFFFAGDSNMRFSTREAGYVLLPMAVLMAAGVASLRRAAGSEMRLLLVGGILLAPIPAVLAGDNEVKRWLTILPFAVLLAAYGVQAAMQAPQRAARVALCVLLAAGVWQFDTFVVDYWGAYRARSSFYFFGNLKGAIREIVLHDPAPECVFLDERVTITGFWRFYTKVLGRPDLAQRTNLVDTEREGFAPPPGCHASTVLVLEDRLRDNHSFNARVIAEGWSRTAIPEPDAKISLVVLHRVAGS